MIILSTQTPAYLLLSTAGIKRLHFMQQSKVCPKSVNQRLLELNGMVRRFYGQ
jgi:hypothetical protein